MIQYGDICIGSGDILIAPPRMQDSRFYKSVIMLTQEKPECTLGLVLNRQSGHTVSELVREVGVDLGIEDWPLYWGGPVNSQTIWMLHDSSWQIEGSTIPIDLNWSMTSNISMFHHLVDGDRPQQFRIFFGFCSWQQGQLQKEIAGQEPYEHRSSWLIWHSPDSELVLEVDPHSLWAVGCEQTASQAVNSWI